MAATAPVARVAPHGQSPTIRAVEFLLACFVAVALTVVFWQPLWAGGGLIGGDIYAYFFPQKAFYAEQLRAGSLPLWNNLVGWGYPQLAESQTGVFYPLHLPLYGLLELNTAYNASQILHFSLAFLFTWLYARELRFGTSASLLAALVYVYGWFPARISLEWAIIGGTWLPLALWCVERFLRTTHWRYAFGLAFVLAVQMLAGHFTLAFITQATLAAYIPLRLYFSGSDLPADVRSRRWLFAAALFLALGGAFALAAVQLLPTWELKQHSQREHVSVEHDPAYGYLPWKYVTQTIAPWYWYPDEQSFRDLVSAQGPRTNRVEAHLYFGLLPLALAIVAVCRLKKTGSRLLFVWLGLGLLALLQSLGVLLPMTSHLPGFSFFEGLGRYGIVTTLAVGLLAASGFESLLQSDYCRAHARLKSRFLPALAAGLALAVMTADLWVVSRPGILRWLVYGVPELSEIDLGTISRELMVAVVVRSPAIKRLAESPLRKVLASQAQPVRLFSEGKNLPSLLGVGTLPTYLGLGPAAYFDKHLMYPGALDFAAAPAAEQTRWLQQAGVTHLLALVPLEGKGWPARRVWSGSDAFINSTMARQTHEPLYLYALEGTRGRVSWNDGVEAPAPELRALTPQQVVVDVNATSEGTLVLTELQYPGWTATIDGKSAEMVLIDQIFRGVRVAAGTHEVVWNYRPGSLYWGAGLSIGAVCIALAAGHIRYWRPHVFGRFAPDSRQVVTTRT